MNLNFELLDLRVFLAILDLHSFHKAAKQLNLSQPALSRRIQSLEERLGTPLLERSTRHVAATAAGRKLEPMARRLLDELDSTLMSISGIGERQSGHISIASIPTAALYFLPRVIKDFNEKYPRIRIRMLDRSPQECLDCVMNGEVEFGINMIGATETDVAFTHLMDDPYVLVCRHDHPLAKKKDLAWGDLTGHPLIRIGRPNSGNRALLDGALTKVNLQLDWFYEVNNLTTSLGLVEAGLGASVLPRLATPMVPHPALAVVPIRRPLEVMRSIGIVERRNGRLSPAAKFFRDMLLANWRDRKSASVKRAAGPRSSKAGG
jgi:DNA-binding transcriptional LysR family regulator